MSFTPRCDHDPHDAFWKRLLLTIAGGAAAALVTEIGQTLRHALTSDPKHETPESNKTKT